MYTLRRRAGITQPPLPHDPAEVAGRHANGTHHIGEPPRGDMGENEDRGREGEGERGLDGSSMSACVVMAYGLVGAAITGAPTHPCVTTAMHVAVGTATIDTDYSVSFDFNQ